MDSKCNNLKNIFLTDDDMDDCSFFSDAVHEIDVNINLKISNDGVELMNILNKSVPPPPYVIFLDLNMPRKNGFECLQEIRKSSKLKNIPIVILSTNSNEDYVKKSYKFGANFYICKPKSYNLLKKSIEFVLKLDPKILKKQPSIDNFLLKLK